MQFAQRGCQRSLVRIGRDKHFTALRFAAFWLLRGDTHNVLTIVPSA
jgi:hypothetical protein